MALATVSIDKIIKVTSASSYVFRAAFGAENHASREWHKKHFNFEQIETAHFVYGAAELRTALTSTSQSHSSLWLQLYITHVV